VTTNNQNVFKNTLILKNVASWYCEITLEILKEKPIKSLRIKAHSNISIMYPLGTEILTNKKNHFKRTFKTRSNFDPSKVHNYHLVKVSPKKYFTLKFIISFLNPCLVTINNLE
jgi:hypothetical protein